MHDAELRRRRVVLVIGWFRSDIKPRIFNVAHNANDLHPRIASHKLSSRELFGDPRGDGVLEFVEAVFEEMVGAGNDDEPDLRVFL